MSVKNTLGEQLFTVISSQIFIKKNQKKGEKIDMACPLCKVVHKNESLNKQEIIIYGLSSIAGACRNFLFRNLMRLDFGKKRRENWKFYENI